MVPEHKADAGILLVCQLFYAGVTPEICALEKFVHLAGVAHPPFKLVAIDIPDGIDLVYTPAYVDLPADWGMLPLSTDA